MKENKEEIPTSSLKEEEIQEENIIKKSQKPLSSKIAPSKYSIKSSLEEKVEVKPDVVSEDVLKSLPANHFTETDLQNYWQKFLENLRKADVVIYSAISGFKLQKLEENRIEIRFPSHTAKAEFDKIYTDFKNGFSHAVNNHSIEIKFENVGGKMKKHAVTKRTVFEEFCEINPLLKDLDAIFKFDLS